MYKKLVYFASVSALTFSLLGSQGKAVYEDEAFEVVQNSLARSKGSDTPKKEESKGDHSTWTSMATSWLTPVASVTGDGLRYLGGLLRNEEEGVVGSFLKEEAINSVKGAYAPTDRVLEKVESSEGTMAVAMKFTGNALRWTGSCLTDETPTLSRDLKRFWIESKEMAELPNEVLPSTVCALMMNIGTLGGVDEVKYAYLSFLKSWNASSQTKPSKDEAENHDYFLRGLLRSLVRTEKKIENFEDIVFYLVAFNFDMAKLPSIKKITEESLFPKKDEREGMPSGELKKAVQTARQEEFMKYVGNELTIERLKLEVRKESKSLFPRVTGPTHLTIEGSKVGGESEDTRGTNDPNVNDVD